MNGLPVSGPPDGFTDVSPFKPRASRRMTSSGL